MPELRREICRSKGKNVWNPMQRTKKGNTKPNNIRQRFAQDTLETGNSYDSLENQTKNFARNEVG
jgi:hypothetical protein